MKMSLRLVIPNEEVIDKPEDDEVIFERVFDPSESGYVDVQELVEELLIEAEAYNDSSGEGSAT